MVSLKSIANLWETVFRSQSARVGFDLIKVKSLVTFQVVTYLGKSGLILKTPLRSLHSSGDFPNGTLDTGFILLDKAESEGFTNL